MKKTIIILLVFSVFFLGFLPIKDTDFGWHYRCGSQFLETGKLCLTNTFSYFLPHYQAFYSGHLYDILLAFIYNHGGFLAISAAGSVILVLCSLCFYLLIPTQPLLSIPVFLGIYFLSFNIFNLGLRPQIITYLFFLLLLLILKKKNRSLLILPFLFLIWVNIHIGFFVGLIMLFIFCADIGYKILTRSRTNFLPLNKLLIILFLSFLATLINPFGINVYTEIIRHAQSPLSSMIAEWVEPPFWQLVLMTVLGLVAALKLIKQKPISVYHVLLLIFFFILAMKGLRNVPFFYTIFFYIFFNNLKIKLEKYIMVFFPILLSLVLFLSIIMLPQTFRSDTDWNTYCNNGITVAYPCEALKKYPHLSGNVYANYEWGGFLIWKKPNIKVFVDGRMPAWKDENGKSPYQVYLEIIQTKEGWNEKLRSLKTNYIFITNGTFLDLLLQKDNQKYGWIEKYRDSVAVIYKAV